MHTENRAWTIFRLKFNWSQTHLYPSAGWRSNLKMMRSTVFKIKIHYFFHLNPFPSSYLFPHPPFVFSLSFWPSFTIVLICLWLCMRVDMSLSDISLYMEQALYVPAGLFISEISWNSHARFSESPSWDLLA